MELFIQGIVIGFAIAAPVGPIGILCIQRTLEKGLVFGLVVGLGVATADAVYGLVAGFGLASLSSFLVEYEAILRLVGGVFLVYLGIRFLLNEGKGSGGQDKTSQGLIADYVTTFFLTITNPATIFSFLAIFAGLKISSVNYVSALMVVLGVFLGSLLWWLFLSSSVNYFHKNVKELPVIWVNRISGVIVILFGVYIMLY